MYTKRIFVGLIVCTLFSFVLMGCTAARRPGDDIPRYLKNNIHTQEGRNELKASYANWTDPGEGHVLVPVNTPVLVGTARGDLQFETMNTHQSVYMEFDEDRMGMSNEQYMRLITSVQPISLDGFSDIDLKGIREGKAYVGMTKEGVKTALGYPAVHGTPSLRNNTWRYWTNRWRSMLVEFDHAGKVARIIR